MLKVCKTFISQKQRDLELRNKFNVIRNNLLEFIQFSLHRLLQYFFCCRFLKYNAPFLEAEDKANTSCNFHLAKNIFFLIVCHFTLFQHFCAFGTFHTKISFRLCISHLFLLFASHTICLYIVFQLELMHFLTLPVCLLLF